MDPVTGLVSGVMSVLMPYVVKGAQEFARVAGEAAYTKARQLLDTLKARLAGDKEASDNLARLEEKPDRYRAAVEDILKEKVAQDPSLATELERLLREMGPEMEIIQKIKIGEDVTGLEADELTAGHITVSQEMEEAKKVTGARIKRIG